jgi:hypothetical protein
MTTYWLMFLFPAFLAVMPWKANADLRRLAWGAATVALIVVVGLRFEVGGDWGPYLTKFRAAVGVNLLDAVKINRDPAYWFFNWLLANADLGVWAQNLLCACLSVGGIVALARRQPQPWLALAVAVPYILVVVAMGYTRQAAALGLGCLALLAVQDRRPWRFMLLVVAAAAFHKSAVVLMPLYLFTLPRIKFRHWLLLAAMLLLIIVVLVSETFEAQWHSYVVKQKESEGAVIRVAMNLPPVLLLLFRRRKLGFDDPTLRHWLWMAWASLAAVVLVRYASTAVDRLALYLLPLQMVVYARVFRVSRLRLTRSALSAAVLLLYAAVLFVWLNYSRHADSWIPYRFFPFAGPY